MKSVNKLCVYCPDTGTEPSRRNGRSQSPRMRYVHPEAAPAGLWNASDVAGDRDEDET